jgi:hypothetical protein
VIVILLAHLFVRSKGHLWGSHSVRQKTSPVGAGSQRLGHRSKKRREVSVGEEDIAVLHDDISALSPYRLIGS